jgi:hypothetical protein
MILLARICINKAPVVIGSVHKLGENYESTFGPEITEYIESSKAIIAGDQKAAFCKVFGLKAVV